MTRLQETFMHTLGRLEVPRDAALVAAVSGGPDSMALLHLLASQAELRSRTLVAHVDHGLRPEGAEEARFVKEQTAALGIPFRSTRLEVAPDAQGNLPERLRNARYAFLQEVAGETGVILTAHHADDQAVTMLMRLIEGAALPGLQGIPPQAGNVFRPLLDVAHSRLLAYLEASGHAYVSDPSNFDENKFRNRVRRRLMPLLEEERPGFAPRLSNVARRLREDDAYLQKEAAQNLAVVETGRGWVELPLPRLPHPALLRRIIARVLFLRWRLPAPQASQEDAIAEALEKGRKANLTGRVTLSWMANKAAPGLAGKPPTAQAGRLTWVFEDMPEIDYRLDISSAGDYVLPVGRLTVKELGQNIQARPWFPGDRETCHNEGGKEGSKVADRLSRLIPAHRRSGWPVLTSDACLHLLPAGIASETPLGRFLFEPLVLKGETGLKEAPNEL